MRIFLSSHKKKKIMNETQKDDFFFGRATEKRKTRSETLSLEITKTKQKRAETPSTIFFKTSSESVLKAKFSLFFILFSLLLHPSHPTKKKHPLSYGVENTKKLKKIFQWHALGREEQAKYYELARRERQLHMQMYPDWSSRTNATRGKKRKRKQEPADGGTLNTF